MKFIVDPTVCQKKLEIDDDPKLLAFYEKRINQEVSGNVLGEVNKIVLKEQRNKSSKSLTKNKSQLSAAASEPSVAG